MFAGKKEEEDAARLRQEKREANEVTKYLPHLQTYNLHNDNV